MNKPSLKYTRAQLSMGRQLNEEIVEKFVDLFGPIQIADVNFDYVFSLDLAPR